MCCWSAVLTQRSLITKQRRKSWTRWSISGKRPVTRTQNRLLDRGEVGIALYGDFARSRDGHLPFSEAMRENFSQRAPQAKYLFYAIIDSHKDQRSESDIRYIINQSISVDYRLWDLVHGDILMDIRVKGFSFKSNEKHVTDEENIGKALLETLIFTLAYDDMPEAMTLPAFVKRTTSACIQKFKKIQNAGRSAH
jgi:transcription elongation factor GreA-like protein